MMHRVLFAPPETDHRSGDQSRTFAVRPDQRNRRRIVRTTTAMMEIATTAAVVTRHTRMYPSPTMSPPTNSGCRKIGTYRRQAATKSAVERPNAIFGALAL